MYLFLGNFRATLIPTIAVPVVILGTFGVLGAFGYSINMLTMFAMVLAIGLLVDDAIVVVENVERIMSEEGLSPLEATRKSMDQITSALIGIGLVLSAVFGPMIFFPGSTGVIYRQFSVTVISSMLLSVVVALVLTPVLCASLLKPVEKGHEAAESGGKLLRPFFLWFDRVFYRLRDTYMKWVGRVLGKRARWAFVFLAIVGAMAVLYQRMPTGYLPDEDQGNLIAMIQLPVGSTLEQTEKVMQDLEHHFLVDQKDAVKSCGAIRGSGFAGRGQNQGLMFVKLKDWDLRKGPGLSAKDVAGKAMRVFGGYRGAVVFVFPPPAVTELGVATGFDLYVQDRGDLAHEGLTAAVNQLLDLANKDPRLARVRLNGMPDVPQYKVDIDWEKAGALGVPVNGIQRYLSAAFGSAYVGNFVQGGRVKRVYAQADAPFRMLPEDLHRLHVRNGQGRMVPLSAVASGRWVSRPPAPPALQRLPRDEHPGRARAGPQLRRGDERHGGAHREAPGRGRPRVDGPLLPAADVRVAGRAPLRLLDPRHLPRPRRALRELDGPDLDRPRPPARRHRRRHRLLDARHGERRLLPDRPPDRPRPDDEERDPDRPVRRRRTARRGWASSRRRSRRPRRASARSS